ncbi:hypothetical protein MGN70_005242 [Eutypa lata]|uniref:Putative dpy-30 domain-containing protein n=1 Tax=Eutypa lata (strain UCR-EL1) TaxID=1287681 RepID=M7SUW3_EUTLA|nr:putative dpy-30 domain-containing protein [Eutypa lata UCREL1]KAI1253034.1 hypothetical protein MGN70_005242 [Eutypa lata]
MADSETTLKSTTPIPAPGIGASTNANHEAATDATTTPGAGTPSITETAEKDIAMPDAPGAANSVDQTHSPIPNATTTNAASPAPPARTGTPLRNTTAAGATTTNGAESNTSRAASQHPDQGFTIPTEAPNHGAPVRQYLNSNVTGPLLEGLKALAKDKPKDPLRVLGEFLLQRSKELETSA